jgi:hypothetical protein
LGLSGGGWKILCLLLSSNLCGYGVVGLFKIKAIALAGDTPGHYAPVLVKVDVEELLLASGVDVVRLKACAAII